MQQLEGQAPLALEGQAGLLALEGRPALREGSPGTERMTAADTEARTPAELAEFEDPPATPVALGKGRIVLDEGQRDDLMAGVPPCTRRRDSTQDWG